MSDDAEVYRLPEHEPPSVFLDSAEPGDLTVVVDEFPDACACGSPLWDGTASGGGEPWVGYGLLGGGIGAYALCSKCDRVYKIMDPQDCEDAGR